MNKLKQIEALVEEAIEKIEKAGLKDFRNFRKQILTDLAKRSAQIDEEDWEDSSHAWIGDTIKEYNTRLRCEVKEDLHPAIQHVNAEGELSTETVKAINKLAEVAFNTPINPALQPLPKKMPEWFVTYFNNRGNDAATCWSHMVSYFGTQPREWWQNLKKGDKFVYDNGVDFDVRTFNGKYYCVYGNYILFSIEEGDIGFNVSSCSPYTDPAQSFRSKLTPEMQVEFDKVVSSLTPNTPQP